MPTQAYLDWLDAGRPYTLIRPARAVQAALRGYGLTVYDYPNDAHLKASVPEDHTPFSVTGWPGANRRWRARALDVMPRDGVPAAAARNENAAIVRQLIRDRDAGVPGAMWIKYINWTDESGVCRQERWMDLSAPLRRTTRTSTDNGHVHISGRSDVDDDDRADTYDPIARMSGTDEDMDANQAQQLANVHGWLLNYLQGNVTGTWPHSTGALPKMVPNEQLNTILSGMAASAQREQDMLTAFKALAQGGSSMDTAAVMARIDQRTADVTGLIGQQAARIAELEHEVAAARAAAEANLSSAERAALPSVD
jgi:hypothetical protein